MPMRMTGSECAFSEPCEANMKEEDRDNDNTGRAV